MKHALRLEAMSPTYKLDEHGRRVVEKKKDTKDRLGRSPDNMDALNLAYYEGVRKDMPTVVKSGGGKPSAPRLISIMGG
jgi:hypothetical protein